MTENNDSKLQEDLTVTGKRKSYKKKKKKSNVIFTVLIILLLGVMGYSGYQVVSTLIRDSTAKNTYDNIVSEFVSIVPAPPAETRPTQTKTAETEPGGSGQKESHEGIDPDTHLETPTKPQKASEAETEAEPETVGLSRLSVDFGRLQSINRDVVAWLQGQGDSVNYPVVQGKDNDYYLNHLIDGSYNGNGTLFVYDQNKFLQDTVTYIFGHHMQNGAMFGSLGKYDQVSYFTANPEFRLYTPDKTYTLLVYTVFYGTGMENVVMNYGSEAAFNQGMAAYASRSLYSTGVNVSYGDKLVCLCTCAYHVSDGRYFIFCKVVDYEE